MVEKEQKLESLQNKVSELKTCSQSQETPAKLQVLKMIIIFALCCVKVVVRYVLFHLHQLLENDLRKKISAVQKLHDQAKGNLMDFSFQKKQLEDYISQMSAWLKSMEDSLISSPSGSEPEDVCRVKVLPKSQWFLAQNYSQQQLVQCMKTERYAKYNAMDSID